MHGIALGTGVKHGVECDRVQADAPLLHFLIRTEDLLGKLGHGEAFEIGGVSHGVDGGPRLLRVRMAVDQLQSLVWLPIHHQGHCHATERQRTGLQSTGIHLLPQRTDLVHIFHQSKRLDHGVKDGSGDVERHARQPVQQLRQRLHVFKPVASVDRTGKQGVNNLRLQHEVEVTLDIAVVSVCRQTLQQDGARHGCDREPSMCHLYPSRGRERVEAH